MERMLVSIFLGVVVPLAVLAEEPDGVRLATPVIADGGPEVAFAPDTLEQAKRDGTDATGIWLASGYHTRLHPGIALGLPATPAGVLIVQFAGSVRREWRDALLAAGIEIVDYVQENGYVVRVPPAAAPALRALVDAGTVRAIAPYPAAAKIHRTLVELAPGDSLDDDVRVHVVLFDPPSDATLAALGQWMTIDKVGFGVESFVRARIPRYRLAELAVDDGVLMVEPDVPARPTNIESAMASGDDRVVGWGSYDGSGVRVAVDDTGIARTGSSTQCGASGAAYHGDLSSSRILDEYDFQNNDTIACDDDGHGTHTTGTIAGAGLLNQAYRGMAPSASLLVYKDCCFADDTGFANPGDVFSRAAAHDAQVVGNSWGGGNNIYTFSARSADRGVLGTWNGSDGNPQYMLMSISSGNDDGLTASPGTSKNAITVGAMKDGNWPDDGPWCFCASQSPVTCTSSCSPINSCVDSYWPPTQRACFSNYGPVDTDGDGNKRVKPDLVAPGTRITSTAASHLVGGAWYETKNGTSMAQPSVAGALALLEDAYPSVVDWPEMYKAKLLAAAVDLGNKNSYGHGMLDVLHAIYDTSGEATVLWTGNYISATGASRDHYFTIPAGFKEVRVYLTFSDPASTTTETVNDLDLRVYDGAGTLVASALGREETVESIRIGFGTAGTWRANVSGYNVPSPSAKYGIAAVAVLASPALTLTKSATVTCVKPGSYFNIGTTLSNSGRSAAAGQMSLDVPPGMTLYGVNMPTLDGQRNITYFENQLWRDSLNAYYLTVGQTNNYVTRSATWTARADPAASDGNYAFLVDASAFGISLSAQSQSIKVDGTAPGLAGNLTSTDHTLGTCSNDTSVTLVWNAAPDGSGCGVDGYSFNWNYPGTLPTATKTLGTVTTYTGNLASSASPYSFNLRAVDQAGNWSPAYASFGPFYIDAIAPGTATGLASSSHAVGSCTSDTSLHVSFTAAPDAECGLLGYGRTLTSGGPSLPPASPTIGVVTSETVAVAPGDSTRYYNLRAVDLAGNWASGYATYGPFTVDLPPGAQGGYLLVKSGADIDMSWTADPAANFYRVYRATDPTFATRSQVGGDLSSPATTEIGGIAGPDSIVYYQVVGTSICLEEGP